MGKKLFKGKKERFSLRKSSVGLISAIIGAVCIPLFSNSVEVAAETVVERRTVRYEYVSEDELTEQEKQKIITEIPRNDHSVADTYYLVYKKTPPLTGVLPNTGSLSSASWEIVGSLCIILVIAGKGKKKQLVGVLALTAAGSLWLDAAVQAKMFQELSAYNQQVEWEADGQLPLPRNIQGYTYVGYFTVTGEEHSSIENAASIVERQESEKITPVPVEKEEKKEELSSKVEKEPGTSPLETEEKKAIPTTPIEKEEPKEELSPKAEKEIDAPILETEEKEKITPTPIEKEEKKEELSPKSEKEPGTSSLETEEKKAIPTTPVEKEEPKEESSPKMEKETDAPILEIEEKEKITPVLVEKEEPKEELSPKSEKEPSTSPLETEETSKDEDKIEIDKTSLEREMSLEETTKAKISYKNATEGKNAIYDQLLLAAKTLVAQPNATQAEIDQLTTKLQQARLALDGVFKQSPQLDIKKTEPDATHHAVTLTPHLEDPDNTYLSSKVQLYQGDTLVQEIDLSDVNKPVTLTHLEYDTPYLAKILVTYTLDSGATTEEIFAEKAIELTYKKVEIREMDTAELYEVFPNQPTKRLYHLKEVPEDLSHYYVKIKANKQKELWLPLAAVQEVEKEDGTYYALTVTTDGLVHNQGGLTTYQENDVVYIPKYIAPHDQHYFSFVDLVAAIQKNPKGTYYLGKNLSAKELTLTDQETYIPTEFTGTLIGQTNNQTFGIFDLSAPLFHHLKGATIQQLHLGNVAIRSGNQLGSLAKTASNTTIKEVHVAGSLTGSSDIGGVVYAANQKSILQDVSFTGKITAPVIRDYRSNIGGIVGHLDDATLQKAVATVELTVANQNNNNQRIAGLVAQVENGASIDTAIVKGTVTNTGTGGYAAGVVASTWQGGSVKNVISHAKVNNGYRLYGDSGALAHQSIREKLVNVYAVMEEVYICK